MPHFKHTPEPWSVGRKIARFIYASDETPISECDSMGEALRATEAANAHRIVACVNACAGVEDPAQTLAEVREALRLAYARLPQDSYGEHARKLIHGTIAKLGKG